MEHRHLQRPTAPERARTGGGVRPALVAAAAATVLTTAGCSAASAALGLGTPPPPPSARPAVVVGPQPSSAPPAPVGAAPPLRTTGTTWPTVVGDLVTYGGWLVRNPSATTRVDDITSPGCPVREQLLATMQALSAGGLAVQAPTTSVLSTTGPRTAPSGSPVVVTLTASRPSGTVLAASGTAVGQYGALPVVTVDAHLVLAADKKWRLCSIDPLDATSPDDDADDLALF